MKKAKLLSVLVLVSLLVTSLAPAGRLPNPKKVPFEEAVTMLNTPQLVQSWLHRYFKYDMKKLRTLTEKYKKYPGVKGSEERWIAAKADQWKDDLAYPSETYYSKKGLCFDAANFAAYCLYKAGYEVVVLSIRHTSGRPTSHTVCVFKSKRDGKLYVAGDTRKLRKGTELRGPYTSLREAAEEIGNEKGRKLKYYFFGRKKFEGDTKFPGVEIIEKK